MRHRRAGARPRDARFATRTRRRHPHGAPGRRTPLLRGWRHRGRAGDPRPPGGRSHADAAQRDHRSRGDRGGDGSRQAQDRQRRGSRRGGVLQGDSRHAPCGHGRHQSACARLRRAARGAAKRRDHGLHRSGGRPLRVRPAGVHVPLPDPRGHARRTLLVPPARTRRGAGADAHGPVRRDRRRRAGARCAARRRHCRARAGRAPDAGSGCRQDARGVHDRGAIRHALAGPSPVGRRQGRYCPRAAVHLQRRHRPGEPQRHARARWRCARCVARASGDRRRNAAVLATAERGHRCLPEPLAGGPAGPHVAAAGGRARRQPVVGRCRPSIATGAHRRRAGRAARRTHRVLWRGRLPA